MRILMLNFERGWRGGERQTLLCMEELRRAGQQAALLARRDSAVSKAAQAAGFPVLEAQSRVGLCMHLWRCRKRYDVFHAQTANTMTWLALLRPVLRGVIVFTRRTAFPVQRRQRITAWKWRRAHALVAISQAAAAEPRRLGLAVRAIIPSAVTALPVDVDAVSALQARYAPEGRPVLGTLAALTREKDPLTLIRAVHQLRQWRDDFVFLHFGAGGALEAAARKEVARLGMQQYYIFVGFRQDISTCYRLMDMFVLSSREEALGSSVLDAFLYGVPVVSTEAGGLAEILADGRGITCPVGDSDALARGMRRVLDEPAQRALMVRDAYAYVLREHAPASMADRYLALYQTALRARR